MREHNVYEERSLGPVRWAAMLAPVAVLLVIVGIISALVLTGVVQGDAVRAAPESTPTAVPTIEITP